MATPKKIDVITRNLKLAVYKKWEYDNAVMLFRNIKGDENSKEPFRASFIYEKARTDYHEQYRLWRMSCQKAGMSDDVIQDEWETALATLRKDGPPDIVMYIFN